MSLLPPELWYYVVLVLWILVLNSTGTVIPAGTGVTTAPPGTTASDDSASAAAAAQEEQHQQRLQQAEQRLLAKERQLACLTGSQLPALLEERQRAKEVLERVECDGRGGGGGGEGGVRGGAGTGDELEPLGEESLAEQVQKDLDNTLYQVRRKEIFGQRGVYVHRLYSV